MVYKLEGDVKLYNYACGGAGATEAYDHASKFGWTEIVDQVTTETMSYLTQHVDAQVKFFLFMAHKEKWKIDEKWMFSIMIGGNDLLF